MRDEDFVQMYDEGAEQYMQAQSEFYKSHEDASRKIFYGTVGAVEGKKLLDAGCGFGKDLDYFQQKGADVTGIDSSQGMIDLARETYPELQQLSVQRIEKTSFVDNSFDIITSRYAFQDLDSIEEGFRELHRILKPGGHLIILVGHPVLAFVNKNPLDYFSRELVRIPLFENQVAFWEPPHTFQDYLSPFALEHFNLSEFVEAPEDAPRENSADAVVPDFLCMKFTKK